MSAAGIVLSLIISLVAVYRSRQAVPTYYEGEVYGMTPAVHRRYALVSLCFMAAFAASIAVRSIPVVPLLGGYVIFMVFYLSSFARGYGE
ncbi:MAG TPA: hypothetical protein VFL13_08595 [Candidatus Baltobacteraceae bacterium]|nr:hypothetical protein [Candidatus Baltobacteraceae bacterium]